MKGRNNCTPMLGSVPDAGMGKKQARSTLSEEDGCKPDATTAGHVFYRVDKQLPTVHTCTNPTVHRQV